MPVDKYWGASTQRSSKYFDIGDFLVRPIVIKSIAMIKKAAATVNAKNGDIVVARINDEVTVKTFKSSGEGKVTLEPQNKDFKSIKIDLTKEEFYLEGICVGVIKRF